MTVLMFKIFSGKIVYSLKIEAIKAYIKFIGVARQLGILWIATGAALLLVAAGFMMVHLGIVFLLYMIGLRWAIGWIVLALGLIYIAVGAYFVRYVCLEKTWLDISRSSEILEKISEN